MAGRRLERDWAIVENIACQEFTITPLLSLLQHPFAVSLMLNEEDFLGTVDELALSAQPSNREHTIPCQEHLS
jgi:hypothetical protein